MDSCLSASNRGSGFHIETAGKRFHFGLHRLFPNGHHGIILTEAASSIRIEKSASSSNGASGIRFETWKGSRKKLSAEITNVNVTGHYYGAAMSRCLIEDNFNHGIIFEGATINSTISILNSNFTQNRGSTFFVSLLRDSAVLIRGNAFTANHLNDFGDHEAVIKLANFVETTGLLLRCDKVKC
ncbi:hypothetical protein COOONC_06105 [Cooperia oncophora]